MTFYSVESGKISQHVVDIFLLLRSHLLNSRLLLEIQQIAADHKLLSSDPFGQLVVINVNELKLHVFFFLSVIFVELHFCKKQLCLIVILDLEIASSWHVSDYFSCVGSSLRGGI